MQSEQRKTHWEQVYGTKQPTEVSWFQPIPEKSLQLIRATGVARGQAIIDAGGGASTLVDNLLADGFTDVSVLDISANALLKSQERLGERAGVVSWIEADVTEFEPQRRYDLWHDRAVFHFLTDATDRDRYVEVVRRSLNPGGHLVLATFGPQGPIRCSGLDICRYGVEQLTDLLGTYFSLQSHELDEHRTPSGAVQQFLYSWWRTNLEQGEQ